MRVKNVLIHDHERKSGEREGRKDIERESVMVYDRKKERKELTTQSDLQYIISF